MIQLTPTQGFHKDQNVQKVGKAQGILQKQKFPGKMTAQKRKILNLQLKSKLRM